jgi:hypothetical protein
MTKEELVEKIKALLKTDDDLKVLIANIRDGVDQVGGRRERLWLTQQSR